MQTMYIQHEYSTFQDPREHQIIFSRIKNSRNIDILNIEYYHSYGQIKPGQYKNIQWKSLYNNDSDQISNINNFFNSKTFQNSPEMTFNIKNNNDFSFPFVKPFGDNVQNINDTYPTEDVMYIGGQENTFSNTNSSDCPECPQCPELGDLNEDANINILDVVKLVNRILNNN